MRSNKRKNPSLRKALPILGLLLAVLDGACTGGQDHALVELHAALVPLRPVLGSDDRDETIPGPELCGAGPALMGVKRSLRDWIETRLTLLGKQGNVDAFTLRLNDELQKADLFCEAPSRESTDRCVDKKQGKRMVSASWQRSTFVVNNLTVS
jgi:hypothetical protein